MPPRKKKVVRRRKSLISLIDVGTSIVVANATTRAFFGTNAWNFFTNGWFGRPNTGTGNSWTLSLNELVMGAIDPSTNYGMSSQWQNMGGVRLEIFGKAPVRRAFSTKNGLHHVVLRQRAKHAGDDMHICLSKA